MKGKKLKELQCYKDGFNLVTFLTNYVSSRLKEPRIVPDAHRAKANVQIGETDPEQTKPCPKHVSAIEAAYARVGAVTTWRF